MVNAAYDNASRMKALSGGSAEALRICIELSECFAKNADTLRALKDDGRELDPIVLLERQKITGDRIPRLYAMFAGDAKAVIALLVNDATGPYMGQMRYQDELRAKYQRKGEKP
jgi:hypothetical protein